LQYSFAHPNFIPGCFSGHYTGHFKSVITKHQNVFVMKDIMANGYRAGGNTKFFVPTTGTDKGKLQNGAESLMKRLNMDDTTGDDQLASLLAFPMSAEQYDSGNIDIVMSVTSRLLPYEVADRQHKSFPGGEAMYKFYEQALGLRAIHFGEDLRASENMEYMSQVCPRAHVHRCMRSKPALSSDSIASVVALRARQTTPCALSVPTAAWTSWRRSSSRSSRAWATGAPTRALATYAFAPSTALPLPSSGCVMVLV
jgi:hypothetical protein